VHCMACKRSSVRSRSSPFTENAAGIEPVAFFDGARELVILGLTRSDPFVDPLDAMIDAIGDVFGNQCRIVYNHFRDPG